MDSRRLATVLCVALAAMLLGLPGAAGANPATSGAADGRAGSPWPVADVMGAEQARWRIATTANREVKINAQMVIASVVVSGVCARCGPGGTDTTEERCRFAIFVQFPHVAGAASYNVVVQDKHPRINTTRNFTGPPFNDNIEGYKTPGGVHWFGGLTGGSGPAPCPTDPYEGGRFEILKAVAIFDGKARIVGTVRKADGTGAARARVTASGTSTVSTKTTAGGGYSMKVKNGRYQVSAKGYCVVGPAGCKKSKTVKVKDGPQQVDFGPRPRIKLAGRVVERSCDHAICSDPAGLGGAEVTATSLDGEDPARASSGPDGAWSVEVPSGRWKVTAAQEGRSLLPSSRKVDANKDVTGLDFESCLFTGTPAGPGCDPDGIDWEMPDRLSPEIADMKLDPADGLTRASFVHPKTWIARLALTKNGEELGSPCKPPRDDIRWRWVVKPRDRRAAVKGKVPSSCLPRAEVTRLGDYDVTVFKERRNGGRWDEELKLGPVKVTLDDILIAGLGDSFGSGEGNPDFYHPRCNRSAHAYQFQAALYAERQDRHTTVTLLHPACSGARIQHLWELGYKGKNPDGQPLLPPQITQVARRLRPPGRSTSRRDAKVDAVIVATTVNDVGFGAILGLCVPMPSETDCPDVGVRVVPDGTGGVKEFERDDQSNTTLEDAVRGLTDRLGLKYTRFAASLQLRLGRLPPNRVLLTEYPKFGGGPEGVCDTRTYTRPPDSPPPWWGPRTWRWTDDVAEGLNTQMHANGRFGSVVEIEEEVFRRRGYCAPDSLFRGIGSGQGWFHPVEEAHEEISKPTRVMLCAALYGGNTECKGRFGG